jgi:predicted nicotinamide N-methyase
VTPADLSLPKSALNVRDYIRDNFPLTPVPFVPEIQIHKAVPKSGIWRLAEIEGKDFQSPYWTSWWGGGVALARHVLDQPDCVAGERVLDLGAGSGLVGIAAAKSGAKSVLAVDIDRYACAASELNAEANGVSISTHLGDITAGEPPEVDVVLVGDLFYDRAIAERTAAFLTRCVARGMNVYVGDPGRAYLPRGKLRLLAKYKGVDFGDPTVDNARYDVFAFAP